MKEAAFLEGSAAETIFSLTPASAETDYGKFTLPRRPFRAVGQADERSGFLGGEREEKHLFFYACGRRVRVRKIYIAPTPPPGGGANG